MINVDVRLYTKPMQKKLNNIEKKYLPSSTRLAINDTTRLVRTEARTSIWNDINKAVKKGKVNEKVKSRLVKKTEKDINNMQGRVYAFGSRFGVIDTQNVRQIGKIGRRPKKSRRKYGGVKHKSFKGGVGFIQHGFIATMRNGHTGVMLKGRSAPNATGRDKFGKLRKGRHPMVEEKGPSVPKIFLENRIERKMLKKANAEFPRLLEKQLERSFKKAGL